VPWDNLGATGRHRLQLKRDAVAAVAAAATTVGSVGSVAAVGVTAGEAVVGRAAVTSKGTTTIAREAAGKGVRKRVGEGTIAKSPSSHSTAGDGSAAYSQSGAARAQLAVSSASRRSLLVNGTLHVADEARGYGGYTTGEQSRAGGYTQITGGRWTGEDDSSAVWELPDNVADGGMDGGRGWVGEGNATLDVADSVGIKPHRRLLGRFDGRGRGPTSTSGAARRTSGTSTSGADRRTSGAARRTSGTSTSGADRRTSSAYWRTSSADRRRDGRGRGSTPTSGAFSMGYYGCLREFGRAKNENTESGAGKRVARLKILTHGQRALIACIKNVGNCGAEAAAAAYGLPGMKLLRELPRSMLGGKANFKSCAIVGNAGHLAKGAYGAAIDRHDAVMRFNVLSIGGAHAKMVGRKTDFRVLNHLRSLHGCCKVLHDEKQANKLPERSRTKRKKGGKEPLKLILWHPGQQRNMMAECRRSNPGARVFALAMSFIQKQVRVIKALRMDLMTLGFGPFTSWKQLTSGAHGIFTAVGMCDSISLYGFTSFPPPKPKPSEGSGGAGKAPSDQYGGRRKKGNAAVIWHDWNGESYVWRLLHASAKMTVCSV